MCLCVQIGVYRPVSDPSNLRSAMASYYEQFKETSSSEVVFSVPYIDAFGTGKSKVFVRLYLKVLDTNIM